MFDKSRKDMVKRQLIARGVSDAQVVKAFLQVSREEFVLDEYRDQAYTDRPLPIGKGQTISQPYTVAYMTELLNLEGGERVLEIGTGSGYQAAILAQIADVVYTVEIVPELAEQARKNLKRAGVENVEIRVGDGRKGWLEKAPFDDILVPARAKKVPKKLFDQLKEGGRMVIPLGSSLSQKMTRVTKVNGEAKKETFGDFRFVPLVSAE